MIDREQPETIDGSAIMLGCVLVVVLVALVILAAIGLWRWL